MNGSDEVAVAPASPVADRGSFRDPRSRVYRLGDRILRGLSDRGRADFDALAATTFYKRCQAEGTIVATKLLDGAALDGEGWAAVLEHEPIPVVSYPYEWPFSMLQTAAILQLELVAGGLDEQISCKDGTPYNVQFVGSTPTFVDLGSFEPTATDAWPGYRQFCSMFLYPLMLEAYVGVSFAPWLRGSLEGITPEEASRLLRGRVGLRKGVFSHVKVQAAAAKRYAERKDPAAEVVAADGSNATIIAAVAARTAKIVGSLRPPGGPSEWSEYSDRGHYVDGSLDAKDRFVSDVLVDAEPRTVLDLGCNDGKYAEMAARHASYVVAVDADRRVVDRLYRRLQGTSLPILPLVGDLADPSPSLGWAHAERTPLSARFSPDLVFSLALIHHLVIGRNIPIASYLDVLASYGPRHVLEIPTERIRWCSACWPPSPTTPTPTTRWSTWSA